MTIKRDKYKTLRRKENISFQYNCNLKKKKQLTYQHEYYL